MEIELELTKTKSRIINVNPEIYEKFASLKVDIFKDARDRKKLLNYIVSVFTERLIKGDVTLTEFFNKLNKSKKKDIKFFEMLIDSNISVYVKIKEELYENVKKTIKRPLCVSAFFNLCLASYIVHVSSLKEHNSFIKKIKNFK